MTIQTFTAGQTLTASQMNTLQASDFNFTKNIQTGTAYTLVATDRGKLLEFSNSGSITLTIPTSAAVTFEIGDRVDVLLASTGSLTISGASGVSVAAEGGITTISSQWTRVTLIKRTTDDWVITGGSGEVQTAEIEDGAITEAKLATGSVTSNKILDGTIVNADINASAEIAKTKIAGTAVTLADTGTVTSTMLLDGTIVNADINSSAAIEQNKIADSTIDTKTANYVLVLTDKNKFIEMNVSSANTVSIPTDASVNFPIGSQINITQYGTGKTYVVAVTPGTTSVRSTPGQYLRAQYSSATLIKRAANEWYLIGDLSAS